MSIFTYQKFLNEQLLLESLREMNFVLSPRFIESLSKINHVISDEFMKLHHDLDSSQKQTYVDICPEKDDTLTFIQANKASELLDIDTEEKYAKIDKRVLHNIPLTSPVYKQHRSEARIGRFINTLFGATTFPASGSRLDTGTKPNDVESFVRMYKATFNQDEKFELMEVVHGDRISYWYNCNHYDSNENGSMGGSCMADVSANYFRIYVNNPNVGLLILYKNTNKRKIKARAVIWFDLIEPSGRTYMDRVYTNNSSDEELFMEYAKKQGWLYRNQRGYSYNSETIDPLTGTAARMTLTGQLRATDHNRYPYMDTMVYYNPANGKISNKERGMQYYLCDTGGGYSHTNHYQEVEVHSNYHNSDIYQSEAKWCDFGQDWVLANQAVKVWNSGDKWAVPGNPDVVKCDVPGFGNPKYFEKARCVWSDYLNTWVFYSSVREVWADFDRSNSVIDYKKRSGVTFAEISGEFWKIDLCEKVNGVWKLKKEIEPVRKRPVNRPRGWQERDEFIDNQGNIFKKGIYIGKKQV